MTAPTLPLFRASWKMMLRSRGVIFAIVTASLYIAFFGLIEDLDFGVETETIRFFDFVLPGFAVFLMVYQIQDITVAVAASYKARGILKRLATTPLSPFRLIAVQALSYVGLGVVASTLVLAIGRLVGGKIALTANLLWLIPLIAVVAVTSIIMAFGIAGLTPNPQTATNVGSTVSFLMFGFSGVIFPIAALPGPLPDIVPYVVPHTALIEAIRGIALTGAPITDYGSQILIGAAWLAMVSVVAALAYRFTDE
ncbi:MAG: ABC transporter permease [Actinobacteria bacterium]|nr:ABC transporter permease [Actinomycetota bacterium]